MNHKHIELFSVTLLWIGLTGCHTNSLKDIDGNLYKTVTIGSQVWMKENLRTTRYNDGLAIPLVTDYDSWAALTTPAYCWYNNDSKNKEVYGALYNYYTIDTKKLCPEGWYVPADSDWTELIDYLGGSEIAANKLKRRGHFIGKVQTPKRTMKAALLLCPVATEAIPVRSTTLGLRVTGGVQPNIPLQMSISCICGTNSALFTSILAINLTAFLFVV